MLFHTSHLDLLCLAIDFLSRDDLDVLEITCVTLRDIVRKHYSLEPYRHFLRLDVRGDTSTLIGQDHTGVFNQTKLWHYKYIDDLCQRLRHSVVDFADFSNIQVFDDNLLEGLLPARSTWSKGTCRTADNFSSPEVLERAFNELFFCQEMLLGIQERVFTLSQSILSFPCVRQCHRLEIWHAPYPYTKEDIVNWLNEDTAFGNDKTVRILPSGFGYTGNIEELVEYFKEDFAQASSPHRYEMQIILKKSCGLHQALTKFSATSTHQRRCAFFCRHHTDSTKQLNWWSRESRKE
uniref:F-box domain-containing protein n=1 Tax=Ditylenchus dipsaci TaxID=166011 RepID=A0A915DRL1_9BILA